MPPEVEHVDDVAHVDHQLHVVLDQHDGDAARPASSRSSAAKRSVSASSWPAAGSSSSSTGGSQARARASSTSRAWPVGTAVTRRSATVGEPDPLDELVGLARRRRPSSVDQPRWMSAATRTFSRTLSMVNSSSRWNVRASPRRARLVGLSFG